MKKLFLIVSCLLLAGSSPVWAQADSEAIVVRIQETITSAYVTIAKGGAAPEVMQFKPAPGQTSAAMLSIQYQQLVTKLYRKGYVLQGIIPGRQDADVSHSSLIFVKASK